MYQCWENDPTIAAWMSNKGWSDYNQLLQYFVTATDGFVTGTGKKTVTHWNDVFDASITVPTGTIFQVTCVLLRSVLLICSLLFAPNVSCFAITKSDVWL